MSERLILVQLRDPKKTSHVMRILAQIPSLTAGVIRNKLHSLPWMLPEISDHQTLDNIRLNLEKMGCVVELKYLNTRPLGTLLKSEKADSGTQNTASVSEPDAGGIKQEFKTEFSLSRTASSAGAGLHYSPVRGTEPKIKGLKQGRRPMPGKAKSISLIVLLFGIMGMVLLGWISYSQHGKFQGVVKKSTSAVIPQTKKSKRLAGVKSKAASKKGMGHAEYRRNVDRANLAEQNFLQAMKAHLPEQRIGFLKKTVQNNPYHLEAWRELERILKSQGKIKQSEKIRKEALDKNDKVRRVLRGIANQFGEVKTPITLTPAELKFYISVKNAVAEDIFDKGFLLYRHLEKKYNSKKLTVDFFSQKAGRFQMEVPPDSHIPDKQYFSEYFWKVE